MATADVSDIVRRIWRDQRPVALRRADILRDFFVGRRNDAALRARASAEAHKLAGALGSFGLTEGSRLAKALEQHLDASIQTEPDWDLWTTVTLNLRARIQHFD